MFFFYPKSFASIRHICYLLSRYMCLLESFSFCLDILEFIQSGQRSTNRRAFIRSSMQAFDISARRTFYVCEEPYFQKMYEQMYERCLAKFNNWTMHDVYLEVVHQNDSKLNGWERPTCPSGIRTVQISCQLWKFIVCFYFVKCEL